MIQRYFSRFGDKQKTNLLTRDFFELLIINEIFSSKYRDRLVLKGLSAAKLSYDVGDGSDKLELSSLRKVYPQEFLAVIKKIVRKYKNLTIGKISDRRYIYGVEIIASGLDEIKIFVEVSKIKYNLKRGINFDVKVLRTEKWNLKILAYVVLLSELVNKHKELSN